MRRVLVSLSTRRTLTKDRSKYMADKTKSATEVATNAVSKRFHFKSPTAKKSRPKATIRRMSSPRKKTVKLESMMEIQAGNNVTTSPTGPCLSSNCCRVTYVVTCVATPMNKALAVIIVKIQILKHLVFTKFLARVL